MYNADAGPGRAKTDTEESPLKRWLRPRHWLGIALMAGIVPLLALLMATVRGPLYLEINTDPEYAYLLNALRVAEGYSPTHTDHPGTPVQVIGAATLRLVHAVSPKGTLREHVLTEPEKFLRAYQVAVVGLTTLLSFAAGILVFKATGALVYAAAVQSSPLVVSGAAVFMDRPMPEPLMLGLGMLLSGLVLIELGTARPRARSALAIGAVIGIGIATKVLFAPLALVPLAAVTSWRRRTTILAWSLVFFVIAIIPMIPQLGRTLKWFEKVATHTGRYGAGDQRMVDLSAYPRQLWMLITREPAYFGIAATSFIVSAGVLLAVHRRLSNNTGRVALSLGAVSIAQLALLVVVAKHPAEHYLCAGAGIGGLAIALMGILGARVPIRAACPAALVATFLATAVVGVFCFTGVARYRVQLQEFVRVERPTSDFVHASGNAGALLGARVSCVESALHFGNYHAGHLYTADLERMYPGMLFWDWLGITSFGRKLSDEELASISSDGSFRAVVSVWFNPVGMQPAGLEITTVHSLGRERLIRAGKPPTVPEGTPAFAGFTAIRGIDPEEGPYPNGGLPYKVRWGTPPETFLNVPSDGGPKMLIIEARQNNLSRQVVEFTVNGTVVGSHAFDQRHDFETIRFTIQTAPGDNELRIKYATVENAGVRRLCALYRKIQVIPGPR